MKKEVILVSTDKCPLDTLAEMGEQTKKAWIFLHDNAVSKLEKTADYVEEREYREIKWIATEQYPATTIDIEIGETWHKVYRIIADDIAFEHEPQDPEDIFFLNMAE
ncbi:MAG: hypothetical protein HFJ40_03445 [Clostridia bacterium]|nr:hypothetical protein [Clostridia bacterium]